jgi:murein DD-endopeptidase MepM/ murein hydrolase activator NlpD
MATIGEMGLFSIREGISRRAQETLRESAAPADKGEVREVAQEFASLLIFEVLKAMRASIPAGGLFKRDSLANDVYRTITDLELSRLVARQSAGALARVIERAVDRMRETPVRPVAGEISSPFGMRRDPLGRGGERFHEGVDIAAPAGAPVRAVAAGRVVFSASAAGYGNLVAIDHGGGLTTRYAHNGANLVFAGETVAAGQEVALVGSSGRSTGPHLHFEVLKDGRPVDPGPLLVAKRGG